MAVPDERQRVLAAGGVVAEVVREREVRNAERVAHAERLGQLARDVAVARAAEADVHLAEQEEVGAGERRRHDGTPQVIEPRPPLDVPRHRPQHPPARRRHGGRRPIAPLDALEHAPHLAADLRPQRAPLQRLARPDRPQRAVVRMDLVLERLHLCEGHLSHHSSDTSRPELRASQTRAATGRMDWTIN